MGAFIPLSYAKHKTKLNQFHKEALLPVIGITTLICRIVSGIIAYKCKFNLLYLCGCGLVFSSAILFITPFVPDDQIWFQFFYVGAFTAGTGKFSTWKWTFLISQLLASYQALRAVIYCEVLGLENLTNAFGLASLALGLGSFTGISIAGTLISTYGGYLQAYLLAGATCLTSGILTLCLPTISKLKNSARKKR